MSGRKTCGLCGVYNHLHPTNTCKRPRLNPWWKRHFLSRHIKAWLWIHAMPSKARIAHCQHLAEKRGKDWCSLVDCWMYADQWNDEAKSPGMAAAIGRRHDYKGPWSCLCDFPLPSDVGPPRPGWCYCTPPRVTPPGATS